MAFGSIKQSSPGVAYREIDLTNFVQTTGISGGGFVGQFVWGPAKTFVTINDANTLARIFGPATDENYVDWFSAYNFLAYTDNLTVVRVVKEPNQAGTGNPALNSTVEVGQAGTGYLIQNAVDFQTIFGSTSTDGILFAAKFPGDLGDSIQVSIADSATFENWRYKSLFDFAPSTSNYAKNLGASNDEIHVVVIDEDGKFSGTPGSILETYSFLSKAKDTKSLDNEPIFYGTILNAKSQYVWYLNPIVSSDYLEFKKQVSAATITAAGTGYTQGSTTATITGDGVGATATVSVGLPAVNEGKIIGATLTNTGSGYTTATAVVTGDGTGATVAVTVGAPGVNEGKIVGATITNAGTGYTPGTAAVAITGDGTGATATISVGLPGVDEGKITAIVVSNGGSGYNAATTTVTVTGDGSGALFTPVITGGVITQIDVISAGLNYTTATVVITDTDAVPGSGATATATLGATNPDRGKITSINITAPGINYTTATITITDSGTGSGATATATLGATNPDRGKITGVSVVNQGSGYTTATIVFNGDGLGAAATATLGAVNVNRGKVIGINITNPGTGYTNANIVITGAPGTGATASLILTDTATTPTWGQKCTTSRGVPLSFSSLKAGGALGSFAGSFSGGEDGYIDSPSEMIEGWDLFQNTESIDVSLLISGHAGGPVFHKTVVQHVIDDITTKRKDCIVFVSPNLEDIQSKSQSDAVVSIVNTFHEIGRDTSFGVADSGWKLQYDVFNDKYRWVPLNADIAGLCAQTDQTNDPWWSPAGFQRGIIKNVVSLAFNPNKTSRDILYKSNVNSVVSFVGEGTLLYGDRTMQTRASAFSYINVRRLFIVLEKSISRAAKANLFEFNDSYTRSRFVSIVVSYLRSVQAKRGLYDFKVVCDESNNNPDILDRAEFVADIYIKPARTINFVTLNFVAVRTGVDFSEVVG